MYIMFCEEEVFVFCTPVCGVNQRKPAAEMNCGQRKVQTGLILIRSAASSCGNHCFHLRLCYKCRSNRSPHKRFCLIAWKEIQPPQCLSCPNFNDWNDDSTLTHIQTAVLASTPSSFLWDNQFILLSLLCVYWSVGMYVFWLRSTGLQYIVGWDAPESKVIVSDVCK